MCPVLVKFFRLAHPRIDPLGHGFSSLAGASRSNTGTSEDEPMLPSSEWNRRYRQKHPERRYAHSAVNNAVRNGRMTRKPCEGCGTAENVHAHHDDYSKPLDVRWLCGACHEAHHHPEGPKPRKVYPGSHNTRPRTVHPAVLRRVERRAQAKALRSEGLSYKQIASVMGLTKGTAFKLANDVPYK